MADRNVEASSLSVQEQLHQLKITKDGSRDDQDKELQSFVNPVSTKPLPTHHPDEGPGTQNQHAAVTDTGLKLSPQKIRHEPKRGFFYRVGSMSNEDPDPRDLIGVYASSVHYRDDINEVNITEGNTFRIIKDHVFESEATNLKNNYLGICFFGIWNCITEQQDPQSGACQSTTIQTVQIPVGTNGNTSYIWKTGYEGKATFQSVDFSFEYIPCNGQHTEKIATDHLYKNGELQKLWKKFLVKTENQRIDIKNSTLECIGFHFLSKLDACDLCIKTCLVPFRDKIRKNFPTRVKNRYEFNTLCDPVPFIVTFASKNLFNPEKHRPRERDEPGSVELRYNHHFSASLRFYPPILLLLDKVDQQYRCKGQCLPNEFEVKHEDKLHLREKQEFDFIVLMVNNGEPIKVHYNGQV